jgi:hypothetical protein
MYTTEFRYAVVQYMLNPHCDEAANVALIVVTEDAPHYRFHALENPGVKSRKDVQIDRSIVDRFSHHATEFFLARENEEWEGIGGAERFLDELREWGGTRIRLGPARTALSSDVQAAESKLFAEWILPIGRDAKEAPRERAPRDPLGSYRRAATKSIIGAFKKAYGARLNRSRFRQHYAVKGKAQRCVFDLAVMGGTEKKPAEQLFHHLLLLPNADESLQNAAGLCFRWEDILSMNHVTRDLTAVLYEMNGSESAAMREAVRLLKKREIKVATMGQLPTIAARVSAQQHELFKSK